MFFELLSGLHNMTGHSYLQPLRQAAGQSPLQLLTLAAETFGRRAVFSSSLGKEDQVITDLIWRHRLPIRIFTIDTGRLFPETYDLIERTEARYAARMEIYFPTAERVEEYITRSGINGFYESVEKRKDCCHVRKVEPLNRALAGMACWITGIRSAQSDNRMEMPVVEWVEERSLYKINPLLSWSNEQVEEYIQVQGVPVHALHAMNFPSIGCAPCTRAVEEGEDERAGRWWWETSKKECGLHT